jgi:DNA-binding HxlR family transcriptional regulator
MADSTSHAVPRTPEEPTPDAVFEEMTPCEPYTTSDLLAAFDTSRWTVQRRLDTLVDDGRVNKKKHAENRVTYWVE